jgi:hypothetical protein
VQTFEVFGIECVGTDDADRLASANVFAFVTRMRPVSACVDSVSIVVMGLVRVASAS